ncbi:MAG TPA: DUF2950 domain-containing protein [Steroidobacteraceae bacterium]
MNTDMGVSQFSCRLAALLCALAVLTGLAPAALHAQDTGQKTFPSARQAAEALVAANRDNDVAALQQILGADAASLIASGDEAQDKNDREHFVSLYETHHRFIATAPGKLTLVVGKDEWPLPIPLIKSGDLWRFDSVAGAKELQYQRIGANELAAIKVVRAIQQAQLEYAASGHDGNPPGAYAQRFRSRPGTQDGLYWPVAEGEAPSPAGPLLADAEVGGYERGKGQPFHGYYFRILKSQGPHAHGGAKDYVVDGRMTGGFAVLAYPVEYGASGVMSFLVSRHGTVFERDLGSSTAETAGAINTFDPDPAWKPLK